VSDFKETLLELKKNIDSNQQELMNSKIKNKRKPRPSSAMPENFRKDRTNTSPP